MRRAVRLGRYHLTERIAYGGMAEIYRAFTFDNDGGRRDVAIKRLLPHFTEDQQFLTMLTDEFKMVSRLKHPNIAEVFELGEVDNQLFVAMEYVDGKDLRSTAEQVSVAGLRFGYDDIAFMLAETLGGLHEAHIATSLEGKPLNIVHRDVSPSNVLLGYDGTVKLCDFGIAKAADNQIQTKTGIIKGKVRYMSPEQAMARKLDARSDLFSAASVLYELTTRKAAFRAGNEMDLILAVRQANPVPVLQVNPDAPPELASIIERGLSRSRTSRFQTGLEFRDALLRFLDTYSPRYQKNRLARLLKHVWRDRIERELRKLEEYVIADTSIRDLGRNLIAEALGPDARYQKFSPSPTKSTSAFDVGDVAEPRAPKPHKPAAAEPLLHQMDTHILEAPTDLPSTTSPVANPPPGPALGARGPGAQLSATEQLSGPALDPVSKSAQQPTPLSSSAPLDLHEESTRVGKH